MSERSNFEFRGRRRHEILWSISIYVDQEDDGLDIGIYEESSGLERPPAGILECVTAPITAGDRSLLK